MVLDFVTIAFAADLPLLRLQARSLVRYLDPAALGQIILIGNEPRDPTFATRLAAEITPEYGPLAPRLRILPGEELNAFRGAPRAGNGWRRQQALKLEAHRLVQTPAYVTLDCKNHLIRPTDTAAFADETGRLRLLPRTAQPGHLEAFDLFGTPPESRPETMFHIITPFALHTAEVAAMDAALRARHGFGSSDAILADTGPNVAEYRLYCAHLVAAHGNWDALHSFAHVPFTTFFAREDRIEPFLRRVDSEVTRGMGVHRRTAWSPPEVKAAIIQRWLTFGLIASTAEGEAILTPPPGSTRPA
ncbi:DUF6492 family protein [Roseomonas sp. WA12]